LKQATSPSPKIAQGSGEKSPAGEPRLSFLSFYLLAMISAVMLTFAPGLAAGLALGTLLLKAGTPKATASSSGSEIAIVAMATRPVPPNTFDLFKIAPLDETTDTYAPGVCPAVAVPAAASIPMPHAEYHGLTSALSVREVCLGSGRYGRAPPRCSTPTESSRISCLAIAAARVSHRAWASPTIMPAPASRGTFSVPASPGLSIPAPSIALPKPAFVLSEPPSAKLRDVVLEAASGGPLSARSSGPCPQAAMASSSATSPLRI
jgi:hypothetical protein